MRVTVTGAAGYIGWALVHELRAQGHRVTALVHRERPSFPEDVDVRGYDLLGSPAGRSPAPTPSATWPGWPAPVAMPAIPPATTVSTSAA